MQVSTRSRRTPTRARNVASIEILDTVAERDLPSRAGHSRCPFVRWLRGASGQLIRAESGPAAVEYGVLLALIVTIAIMSISLLGVNVRSTFSTVSSAIFGQPGANKGR